MSTPTTMQMSKSDYLSVLVTQMVCATQQIFTVKSPKPPKWWTDWGSIKSTDDMEKICSKTKYQISLEDVL